MSVRTMSQQKASAQNYNKLKAAIKGSVSFDGTGDYLSVASNTALNPGTGNFTIECWWNPANFTDRYQTVFDKGFTSSGGILLQLGNTAVEKFDLYVGGSKVITSNTAVTANAWTHIAVVRDGTSLALYQNGVSMGTATNSTNITNTDTFYIGVDRSLAGNSEISGNISNFRLVKGTAVYTSAFTRPTTPLTVVSGTSLLTCHLPTTISDKSQNNFTVTATGNAAASSSSPF